MKLRFALLALAAVLATFARRLLGRKRHRAWSVSQEIAVEVLTRNGAVLRALPPDRARARMDALALPPSTKVRKEKRTGTAGSALAAPRPSTNVRVEKRAEGTWFLPDGAPGDAAIVYAHGGSFVIGSVRSYADLLSRLAAATGVRVLGFDYRLAPEHRFPAALDDTVAAATAAGVPPHRLLLAGDSAGGNLALGAALELARRRQAPGGLILLSPWVDLTCSRASVQRNARLDWGDGGYLKHWVPLYLPAGVAADDPRVSPLNADLSGLPPIQLHVGTAELLHDEVVELSERAIWANVGVDLRKWPDMVHGWALLPAVFPAAADTLRACATFTAERLSLSRSSRPNPLPLPAAAPPPRSR